MSDVTDATTVSDDLEVPTPDAADSGTVEQESATETAEEAPVATEAPSDETVEEETVEAESDSSDEAEAESAPEAGESEDSSDESVEVAEGEETGDAEEAEEEAPRRRRDSPYDRPGRWYVIHTQSGYENKVRSNLLARTQSMNMEERIFEVVIPLEDVVEFKNGKKVVVQKKVFPGYLLTRMHLDDDSWFVVRNTPGVTGFIGAGNKPSPLPRRDVENFLTVKDEDGETTRKGRPRLEYQMGETVRVKEGPFADFQGEIVEINEDQLRLKVLVNIFGRETPVELQFAEVAKI